MRIKPKEVRRTVKLLEDPQPGWMALVDNGANQTPLNIVKRDQIKREGKETKMAKRGKGSKAPNSRLTKMQFSKAKFATKKSVRAFLDENNIEGVGSIDDGDDVWIVKSSEDFSDVTLGKPRSTATKTLGVTAFVAPVLAGPDDEDEGEEDEDETVSKGADDPDEDDDDDDDGDARQSEDDDDEGGDGADEDEREEVEASNKSRRKAASKVTGLNGKKTKVRRKPAPKVEPVLAFVGENAQKYDFWGAYTSNEDSLTGVLADGMSYDNVPPGVEEVMMATFVTIGNIFSEDSTREEKAEKLAQLGAEMSGITLGLYDLFENATEDASKHVNRAIRKAAQAYMDAMSESVERATNEDFSGFVNVDNDDDEDDSAKKSAPKKKSANDEEPAWVKRLGVRLDNIEKRVQDTTETLSRSNVSRSMSDSLADLVEEDDTEDEDEAEQNARLEEVRRSMGLRPSVPAQAA